MLSLQLSHKEYLMAIFTISKTKKGGWVSNSDISELMRVKPASVTGMLQKLNKQNLVIWKPRKKVRLTDKGKLIIRKIIKTRNQLKKFFIKHLSLKDESTLDMLCLKIEHYITNDILDALNIVLKGDY
ncbi:MAG: metal-dependent transcriptional regulator [Candidatus Odinarchaeota archaeon]